MFKVIKMTTNQVVFEAATAKEARRYMRAHWDNWNRLYSPTFELLRG